MKKKSFKLSSKEVLSNLKKDKISIKLILINTVFKENNKTLKFF